MRCEGKPDWLETDWLLSHFGRDPRSSRKAYADYLEAGVKMQSPMVEVKHQVVLGDKEFVAKHLPKAAVSCFRGNSRTQRRVVTLSLSEYQKHFKRRDQAMARAYWSTAYSMEEIARHFRVSPRTVGRAVQR
jgi:hypothetical protein